MSTMARAHGRRYRPCDGDPRRVGAVAKRLEGLTETSTAGPSTRPRLWRAAPALARAAGQRLRTIEQVAAKATKRSARACYGCPLSTVRPAKDRSPLAAVSLGRTRPAEPGGVAQPATRRRQGQIPPVLAACIRAMRDELLDGELYTLSEAQIVIESWRRHYNTIRPHASLGYKPPAPQVFVPAFAAWPAALRHPGSAGHASATASLKLTFNLDHSVGANHCSVEAVK